MWVSLVLGDHHYKRMPRDTGGVGRLKNPHCSMSINAAHRGKFAALHRQWWRLHMSKKFQSWTKNSKQTNNLAKEHCPTTAYTWIPLILGYFVLKIGSNCPSGSSMWKVYDEGIKQQCKGTELHKPVRNMGIKKKKNFSFTQIRRFMFSAIRSLDLHNSFSRANEKTL